MNKNQTPPEKIDNSVFYQDVVVSDETKGYVRNMAQNANNANCRPTLVRRKPLNI